jgi:hypothetical protein
MSPRMEPVAWAGDEPVGFHVMDGDTLVGTVRLDDSGRGTWSAGTAAAYSDLGGFGSAAGAGAWLLLGCPKGGLSVA